MSTSSLALETQPPLIKILLEGLRRDAFAMELHNYGTPALASSEDFTRSLNLLHKQIASLLGNSVAVIAVADASKCIDQEQNSHERKLLCGVGVSVNNCRVWPRRSDSDMDLEKLATNVSTAHDFLSFCSSSFPELIDFLKLSGKSSAQDDSVFASPRTADNCTVAPTEIIELLGLGANSKATQFLLAPYLVHTIPDLPSERKDFNATWHEKEGRSHLVHTGCFSDNSPAVLTSFSDSYFAAAVLVCLSSSLPVSQQQRDWIEALHIMFQLSWGFPTLEEHKRVLNLREIEIRSRQERLQIREEEMRETAKTFRELRFIAQELSSDVHRNTALLVSKLDPGAGFDQQVLEFLFEANPMVELWLGDDGEVWPQHDYLVANDAQNLIFLAVHNILGKKVKAKNLAELRFQAEALVADSGRSRHRVFVKLLQRIMKADQIGFYLLRELCRIHVKSDSLRFMGFLARLFLGPVPDTFRVTVIRKTGELIKIDSENLTENAVLEALCLEDSAPKFPTRPNLRSSKWALPLTELLARRLQKNPLLETALSTASSSHNTVGVVGIDLYEWFDKAKSPAVICHLDGNIHDIENIARIMEESPGEAWQGHGLRGVLFDLYAVAKENPMLIEWKTSETNRTMEFRLQEDFDADHSGF